MADHVQKCSPHLGLSIAMKCGDTPIQKKDTCARGTSRSHLYELRARCGLRSTYGCRFTCSQTTTSKPAVERRALPLTSANTDLQNAAPLTRQQSPGSVSDVVGGRSACLAMVWSWTSPRLWASRHHPNGCFHVAKLMGALLKLRSLIHDDAFHTRKFQRALVCPYWLGRPRSRSCTTSWTVFMLLDAKTSGANKTCITSYQSTSRMGVNTQKNSAVQCVPCSHKVPLPLLAPFDQFVIAGLIEARSAWFFRMLAAKELRSCAQPHTSSWEVAPVGGLLPTRAFRVTSRRKNVRSHTIMSHFPRILKTTA